MSAERPALDLVARGVGPRWLRFGFAVLAGCYFTLLIKQALQVTGLGAITFFTAAACLFPDATPFVIEYRLEVWSCNTETWDPLDPRPYFPIEADSKESRFHRIGHFYQRNREVLRALDDWIVRRYADIDESGVGPIGGIRVIKVVRPIPAAGDPVQRFEYEPMAPIPADERRELYWTKRSERSARCGVAR